MFAVSEPYRSLRLIIQIDKCIRFDTVNTNGFFYNLASVKCVFVTDCLARVTIDNFFEDSVTLIIVSESNSSVLAVKVRFKLTTFPCEDFVAADGRGIADRIIDNGAIAGYIGQQIFPRTVAVSIVDCALNGSKRPCRESVCFSRQNIAGIIISIHIRFAKDLVVFTSELSQIIILN